MMVHIWEANDPPFISDPQKWYAWWTARGGSVGEGKRGVSGMGWWWKGGIESSGRGAWRAIVMQCADESHLGLMDLWPDCLIA